MTSSLVGSEMCIRDSGSAIAIDDGASQANRDAPPPQLPGRGGALFSLLTVSYTHLTLPTICSV
eukprot:11125666-Prorocentrum_lima.AAC.1